MDDPSSVFHRELPPAVIDLAHRCGAGAGSLHADQVVLTQGGCMRADAGHRRAPFRARQIFALERVGFVWRAATGQLGCITVTDALEQAGPRLMVTALGLFPLARVAADAALTKGELQRYLVELLLMPDAILRNATLDWEVLSSRILRVATIFGAVRAHVDLTLGPDGLVASAFARASKAP